MIHNNHGFPNAYMPINPYQMSINDNGSHQTMQYPYQFVPPEMHFYQQPQSLSMDYMYPHVTFGQVNHIGQAFQIPDIIPHQMASYPFITTQEMPSCSGRKVGLKRKASDVDLFSPLPAKIKVDEAKMSAVMNDLNLYSSDNRNDNSQTPWFSTEEQSCMEVVTDSSSTSTRLLSDSQKNLIDLLKGGVTLEMRDEFKVNLNTNEILPKSVVDEIVKPGLQVVLWKPPGDRVLGEIKKNLSKTDLAGDGDEDSTKKKKEVEEEEDDVQENNKKSSTSDVTCSVSEEMMSENICYDQDEDVDMEP